MNTRNPALSLFKATWSYSKGNHKNVISFWCLFIIGNSIAMIGYPLMWKIIIDTIQQQGITSQNINTLFLQLGTIILLHLLFWSMHGPARIKERMNAFNVRLNYRTYLLQGVMTLPMQWHVNHHSGDTIDKVEKGSSALFEFSSNSFEIIYSLVQLAISYAMLSYFSPSAAIIVIVMMFITGWIIMRFDKVLIGNYKQLNRAENKISESIYDSISNIATVITLRVERLVFEAIVARQELPRELFRKSNILNEIKWCLTSQCSTITMILVMGFYLWHHKDLRTPVEIGSVFLLISYLDKIKGLFSEFAGMYSNLVQRQAKVLNAEELTKDFQHENFTNHVLPQTWRELSISGLNFSYNGGAESPHLDNICLSIIRGERIAFIGESGSGKSTLLSVIRGLYPAQSLELKIDGTIVPHGFDGIARDIALVPQKPQIFATTIRNNITIGAEYADETIGRFTEMACFDEVIARLPLGLNAVLNEDGVNLSGGEQQRLALARGLLACEEKDIILLDEPTSSVDPRNEVLIYRNILSGFSGKTIISTIHGLHLLPLFDRICIFENGQIVASGTLNELLGSYEPFKAEWQKYHQVHKPQL